MSDTEAPPEADALAGSPHPRETLSLVGHEAAEAAFLDAFNSGRMHHAWLITGPKGIGKATLAWRIARFLIAQPVGDGSTDMFGDAAPAPDRLDIGRDHPVYRRTAQLAEPRLCLIRREWDAKKARHGTVISVDEVRKLNGFFHMSSADGGRRVVIVDSADEMNISAANALLKTLEEPPKGAVILLVAHQPSRLLPTIRSRCRELRLLPLDAKEMAQALDAAGGNVEDRTDALAELASGSVGEALRLTNLGGMDAYVELVGVMSTLPRLDRPRALKLAESCAGRGNEDRFDLVLRLMDLFLTRLARSGAGAPPVVEAAPGEAAVMHRLAPSPHEARIWAELQQTLSARAAHGRAVNLDPAALILDMVLKVNETASRVGAS